MSPRRRPKEENAVLSYVSGGAGNDPRPARIQRSRAEKGMIFMRTITVKGIGSVNAKPDLIVITFRLEARDHEYEKAMALAARQISAVNEALIGIGFEKGSLKTTDFHVETVHESIRDKSGTLRSVFAGYSCVHRMKISFDLDNRLLGRTLNAIAQTAIDPQLAVSFTVRDPGAVSEQLLQSAAFNARKKAEILCAASGVRPGRLLSIDYSWGEMDVYSSTRYGMEDRCMALPMCSGGFDAELDPEDIHVNDTASFVWEIE